MFSIMGSSALNDTVLDVGVEMLERPWIWLLGTYFNMRISESGTTMVTNMTERCQDTMTSTMNDVHSTLTAAGYSTSAPRTIRTLFSTYDRTGN